MNKRHYIYVIGREEGPVKVGITSSPGGRLSTIQTGCPFRVEILHLRECRDRNDALRHEQIFHDVHSGTRLAGEWFDMEADLAIESVDCDFEFQEYFENEARLERMAAELNIWPWAGEVFEHHA
ncbi:GIY-YIG nuclease family protein [Bradyrhizobium lablabi]|uniref:GIY-YIG nuclease family protein n=1 Tax=Bradyrhizobium lablabi TaxID=722472 RepID=UPI001BA4DE48|nr:GIY-YIG nuclease family protein [Bradyrhizobium lablabi]MBR1122125.1 GIY-YIG nuclease family protein [Bradyrhizobium lablabi]